MEPLLNLIQPNKSKLGLHENDIYIFNYATTEVYIPQMEQVFSP